MAQGHTRRIRLTLAYDGGGYAGWQVQKTGIGVQERLEEVLARLVPGAARPQSSSRTDTGVHALGMVVHVDIPADFRAIPLRRLPLALNAYLPEDIRVMAATGVAADFHARFDAVGKQYRYFLWNHPSMNPLLRHTAWHVPRPLDLAAMRAAAALLTGRHDFRSFAANRSYETLDTVRTLGRLEIRSSGFLRVVILEANGFLYKMCRGLVGTLVQVGQGKLVPQDMPAMLGARDRRAAGMTAPAHGLVLWKVCYRRGRRGARDGDLAAASGRGLEEVE